MGSSIPHNPQAGLNLDDDKIIEILKEKILGKRPADDIFPTLDRVYHAQPNEHPFDKFLYTIGNQCYFFTNDANDCIPHDLEDGYWRDVEWFVRENSTWTSIPRPSGVWPQTECMKRLVAFYWGSWPYGVKSHVTIHEYQITDPAFEASQLAGDIQGRINWDYRFFKIMDCEPSLLSNVGCRSQWNESVTEGFEADFLQLASLDRPRE